MALIKFSGIVIIVGNYGSGKTEVAINLAVHEQRRAGGVRLADLDLVNPYFRTREARSFLTALGVDVVLPPAQYMQADLPILTPEVAGMIRRPNRLTLLDAGGDDVGATVLAALADAFKDKAVQLLQVVNPFRSNTDTIEGCLRIRDEIQTAAKLPVTAWVGNANLIDDTTVSDIEYGYRFARQLADRSGLALSLITVPEPLRDQIASSRFDCPVLPIRRQLVPPWETAHRLANTD